jgi:hypothetical protein
MIQIQAFAPSGGATNVHIDKDPNVCPHCHKSITAQRQQGFLKDKVVQVVYRCPDDSCRSIFIGYFNHQLVDKTWMYVYSKTSLGTIRARDFSENIQKVSISFVDIYNQAIVAEGHGLNHITGIGLRKALEFLINDYLVLRKPDQTEQIQKKMLGPCIKDHLDNPNIKDMAERAVWLGNDHTHYVKKWEDKDIRDLKALIDITLHWIEMEVLTEKYKTEMT